MHCELSIVNCELWIIMLRIKIPCLLGIAQINLALLSLRCGIVNCQLCIVNCALWIIMLRIKIPCNRATSCNSSGKLKLPSSQPTLIPRRRQWLSKLIIALAALRNCQLSIVHCELCIVNCQLCIVHCELWIVNCALWIVNCQLSIVHCQLNNPACHVTSGVLSVLEAGIRN